MQSPKDRALDRIVIGLGNPGSEYEWTRHNMGFHVLDEVARDRGQLFTSASQFPVASTRDEGASYGGPKAFEWARIPEWNAWLIKPMTFMNRSGKVVGPLARFLLPVETPEDLSEGPSEDREQKEPVEETTPMSLGFDPTRLMVVYDDLDLPLGGLRLRPQGGHGGQNGMRSIIEHLGTKAFPRLRVGIGSPGTDAVRHVLETFPAPQKVEAEISVRESAEACLDWLEHGDLEKCMTRFHSRWNRES